MTKKIKLEIELIPSSCHYSNVRTTLKTKDWDIIRFIVYAKADNKCEICQQTGLEQGYRHRVECHEIWKYNDKTHVQKLVGLIALCPLCHQTKHIGRANAIGKQSEVFQQLENVNGWDHKQVVEHVAQAFIKNKERSKFQWTMDLTLLCNPPYNIVIEKLNSKSLKRKFKKKRFKRRKRK